MIVFESFRLLPIHVAGVLVAKNDGCKASIMIVVPPRVISIDIFVQVWLKSILDIIVEEVILKEKQSLHQSLRWHLIAIWVINCEEELNDQVNSFPLLFGDDFDPLTAARSHLKTKDILIEQK